MRDDALPLLITASLSPPRSLRLCERKLLPFSSLITLHPSPLAKLEKGARFSPLFTTTSLVERRFTDSQTNVNATRRPGRSQGHFTLRHESPHATRLYVIIERYSRTKLPNWARAR